MVAFRQDNRNLIFTATTCGLYLPSIESVTSNKWLIAFYTVWTKIPITIIPIYIWLDIQSLIYDDQPILLKFALLRKAFVYFGFFLKNVLFYWNRRRIECLFDLWDKSFKEKFYPRKHEMNRRKNRKENRRLLVVSTALALSAALIYSVPSYFSKTKTMNHPSGIHYPHRSPEFELAVTFDVACSCSCVSAALSDTVLIVLLSHIRSKLVFLREVLVDIIDELVIDSEGNLLGRRTDAPPELGHSVFPAGEEGDGALPPDDEEVYEEREMNGVAFDRNTANVHPKMRIWILHHQQAITLFDEVAKVYSYTASFQLGFVVVYTGMTALNVVQMKLSLVVLGTVLVASSNLMSLFLWCKLSGDLRNDEIFNDAFSRAWFLFPKKVKTALCFIIMRSKKSLALYGFSLYAINLATFFQILKLAYQFFAFMVQFTNNE